MEAAKTTAYWCRKVALVKSTWVVAVMASRACPTMKAAASAQPLASESSGSRGVDGCGVGRGDAAAAGVAVFAAALGRADKRSHGSLEGLGLGVGRRGCCGPAMQRQRHDGGLRAGQHGGEREADRRLAGISEASVLLDGLGDVVGGGRGVVTVRREPGRSSGRNCRPSSRCRPSQAQGDGEPVAA